MLSSASAAACAACAAYAGFPARYRFGGLFFSLSRRASRVGVAVSSRVSAPSLAAVRRVSEGNTRAASRRSSRCVVAVSGSAPSRKFESGRSASASGRSAGWSSSSSSDSDSSSSDSDSDSEPFAEPRPPVRRDADALAGREETALVGFDPARRSDAARDRAASGTRGDLAETRFSALEVDALGGSAAAAWDAKHTSHARSAGPPGSSRGGNAWLEHFWQNTRPHARQ